MIVAQLTVEQSLPYIWVAAGVLSLIFGGIYMITRKRAFFLLEAGIFLILGLGFYSPEGSDYKGIDLNTTLLIGLTALGGFILGFIAVYLIKMATGNLKEDEKFSWKKLNEQIKRKNKETK
jgi:hypothetical protein